MAPIRVPEQIRQNCADKLRSVTLDDHLQVIISCFLGEEWISPGIDEVVINPDGYLFGRCEGESEFLTYLGTATQLLRSIHDVATAAQLDGDELGFLVAKVAALKWQSSWIHKGTA